MSDADMGNVHRSVRPTPRAQQAVGVGQVARRLGYAANSTAQVLYSIANIQNLLTETQSMKQLVQKLYVIALVLSDLTATLVESGEHEVWTEEHDENLLHSLKEFEDIVPAVVRAIREADKTSTHCQDRPQEETTMEFFSWPMNARLGMLWTSALNLLSGQVWWLDMKHWLGKNTLMRMRFQRLCVSSERLMVL
ncbi:uncharacterized protein EKO05_0006252 [Ascochyta rabiei]|uniref:uncharacterized protein n=1 Tax=Didymella rabiei TaxID=5454 RepID=UPI0022001F73|nr:uncharacterized protein EKO05_0006252 [Ascochyta rabiei]UPX15814.1 hypothetical protein EKO05_0006252 [Ascochyta rabiei]